MGCLWGVLTINVGLWHIKSKYSIFLFCLRRRRRHLAGEVFAQYRHYRQTSDISRTLVGNKTSPRCGWSIACRCCSNYIFILDLTPGFKGLSKDNCKTRRETCMFWYLAHLILEVWRYKKSISSCVNSTLCTEIPRTSDAYVRQWIKSVCIQMMACRLFGISSLSEAMLAYSPLALWEQTSVIFGAKYHRLCWRKCSYICKHV